MQISTVKYNKPTMGMYNIIKSDEKCPKCKAKVDEWQSKTLKIKGYPIDNVLCDIILEPDIDGEMHTLCEKCGCYVEFEIKKGKVVKTHLFG